MKHEIKLIVSIVLGVLTGFFLKDISTGLLVFIVTFCTSYVIDSRIEEKKRKSEKRKVLTEEYKRHIKEEPSLPKEILDQIEQVKIRKADTQAELESLEIDFKNNRIKQSEYDEVKFRLLVDLEEYDNQLRELKSKTV